MLVSFFEGMFTLRTTFETDIVFVPGCNGILWSQDVQNGSTIHACAGNDVPLPWKYTLEPFEDVVDVEWYFSPHCKCSYITAVVAAVVVVIAR